MLGAVIAWALMEWTPLMPDYGPGVTGPKPPYSHIFLIGLVSGLLIGLAMGLAEGIGSMSRRDALRSILSGALIGAAGGIVGLTVGNAFYGFCFDAAGGYPIGPQLPSNVPTEARPASTPGILSFLLLLIGRGFGWALIGAFIGISQGLPTSSTKRMTNGAVGGFIGGGLGGTAFELLVWMNLGGVANFPPEMIRFISFGITGAAIGLFIGFIEEVAKKAWLVRLVGRNEGKEYVIEKPVTVIGRSEVVDLPVFGDPDVAERHATITRQGQRYSIEDMGSYSGTRVNDKPVTKEMLRDRDLVMVGKTRFMFRDKATARSGYTAPSTYDTGPKIPSSQHICPFCGSVKDTNGNCQCTVGGQPQSQSTAQPTAQMTAQMPAQPPDQQTAQFAPASQPPHPEPVEGPNPCLVAMAGPYSGQTFPLKPGETQIGRESTKDIGLSMDNTVSRNHARIAQEAGGYVIYDEGSSNGTFVNGARVTRHELANADVVQVGSSKFRLEL